MQLRKDCTVHLAIVSLIMVVGFVYMFAGSVPYPLLFPTQNTQLCDANTTQNPTTGEHWDELEETLARASMTTGYNKTVIIAVVNKAYVEGDKPLLDIFLDAFWVGEGTRALVEHLLLVAMDDTSFDRCKFLRLHCYRLGGGDDDSAEEHVFMSKDFVKMMWKRTHFLAEVLRRGYSFIFTDVDVMWLRNPIPRLTQDETLDLQISGNKRIAGPTLDHNHINTGFYMIRSNNKTVALFDAWYAQRNSSRGMKEQDVLEHMMRGGYLTQLGMKAWFHDMDHFSGFCRDSDDVRIVLTVHADCCRTVRAKVSDLMELIHDWKRFNENKTAPFAWSKHTACQNSWH